MENFSDNFRARLNESLDQINQTVSKNNEEVRYVKKEIRGVRCTLCCVFIMMAFLFVMMAFVFYRIYEEEIRTVINVCMEWHQDVFDRRDYTLWENCSESVRNANGCFWKSSEKINGSSLNFYFFPSYSSDGKNYHGFGFCNNNGSQWNMVMFKTNVEYKSEDDVIPTQYELRSSNWPSGQVISDGSCYTWLLALKGSKQVSLPAINTNSKNQNFITIRLRLVWDESQVWKEVGDIVGHVWKNFKKKIIG